MLLRCVKKKKLKWTKETSNLGRDPDRYREIPRSVARSSRKLETEVDACRNRGDQEQHAQKWMLAADAAMKSGAAAHLMIGRGTDLFP